MKTVWKHIAIPEGIYRRSLPVIRWYDFRSVTDYLVHCVRIDLQKRELEMEIEKSKREGYDT